MRTIWHPNAVLLAVLILSRLDCGNPEVQKADIGFMDKAAESGSQTTNPKVTQIGAGDHSPMAESFVFVARNLETYESLREMMTNLPAESAEFFKSHAVVAAFLGPRPSGGFTIEFMYDGGVLNVTERRPPKGAIVKAVLTSPYKAIAIELGEDEPIRLVLGEAWKKQLRSYRISSGVLMVSGGIRGKQGRLALQGKIDLLFHRELCTFIFDVSVPAANNPRRLSDVASGKMSAKQEVRLFPIDSFSLSGAIRSPFRATARFADEQQRLVLSLETIPNPTIMDNFSAAGSITAIVTPSSTQEK